MNFETSKNLGGVGALLMFVAPFFSILSSFVAFFGLGWAPIIVELIGAIFVLVALKGFADFYKESGIFNNALYGFIAVVVGSVIALGIMFVAAVGLLTSLGINLTNVINTGVVPTIDPASINFNTIATYAVVILVGLLLLVVFAIVMAIFVRRSLGQMSVKTGIGLFGTAGLVLLIGGVLTIIIFGLVLVWIAFLLLAIAFFMIKPQPILTRPVTEKRET
jgi:uncharacterized membrane protein